MNNQIKTWLEFLELSLSLFTIENRVSVFHPTNTPCPNTSGDILFELNVNVHNYLSMIVDKYITDSDDCPHDGELDFILHTLDMRMKDHLKNSLWVAQVTEVEKMSPSERMTFVCDELSRAVDYLKEFFDQEVLLPYDDLGDDMDKIPAF